MQPRNAVFAAFGTAFSAAIFMAGKAITRTSPLTSGLTGSEASVISTPPSADRGAELLQEGWFMHTRMSGRSMMGESDRKPAHDD